MLQILGPSAKFYRAGLRFGHAARLWPIFTMCLNSENRPNYPSPPGNHILLDVAYLFEQSGRFSICFCYYFIYIVNETI